MTTYCKCGTWLPQHLDTCTEQAAERQHHELRLTTSSNDLAYLLYCPCGWTQYTSGRPVTELYLSHLPNPFTNEQPTPEPDNTDYPNYEYTARYSHRNTPHLTYPSVTVVMSSYLTTKRR